MLYLVCGSYSVFATWRNNGLTACSPLSGAGSTLTSGNIFNCHVKIKAFFNSEYIHSLSLLFYDINNFKKYIFFPLSPFSFTMRFRLYVFFLAGTSHRWYSVFSAFPRTSHWQCTVSVCPLVVLIVISRSRFCLRCPCHFNAEYYVSFVLSF